jgi:PTS system N-acetylglucosamine-specific IIC component
VDACTTRLRLRVARQEAVDLEALKALGARGTVRPGGDALQVVIGPIADQLASEIRTALKESFPAPTEPAAVALAPAPLDADPAWQGRAAALLSALGGASNVREVAPAGSRVLVSVADEACIDEGALRALSLRGIARPVPARLHLIVGPEAPATAAALEALLN